MKPYAVGIDSGSTFCKIALIKEQSILAVDSAATGWQPAANAQKQIKLLLDTHGIDESNCTFTATGYGRSSMDFAQKTITEITCHAAGASFLDPTLDGVLDIGGQDNKAIKIQNGKPIDFLMNDKCAAGTGKFLDIVCKRLEVDFTSVDDLADLDHPAKINNMCAVFAESEIIGLIIGGVSREAILGGVLESISVKISQMAQRLGFQPHSTLMLTGGLSGLASLTKSIAHGSGHIIRTHPYAPFAGAIGAALLSEPQA